MTDNEKELRRILDAYIKLSSDNMQQAIDNYKKAMEQQLEAYKKRYNANNR